MQRGGGISLWRQIAESIRSEILTGVHATGDRLPPEAELAARFGVNRHTLRRAMASLATEGLVRVDQGRGTFVEGGRLTYPISRRTRFSEIVSAQAREPGGRLIASGSMQADAALAERLHVPVGSPLHTLETVSAADGVPISMATHFIPAERFPDLVEAYSRTGSLTKAFAAHGVTDYARRSTRVSARIATRDEAERLSLGPMDVVIVTDNLDVDGSGQPIQTSRTRFVAERVELVVETE